MLAAQYIRNGNLFLQCVDDVERKIVTVPASFTDYVRLRYDDGNCGSAKETHFTVKGLIEANDILSNALEVSIE